MEYFIFHFRVFLLIMVRLNSMIIIAPFFSSGVFPFRMKVLLSFFIALLVFPAITAGGFTAPVETGDYILSIIGEIAIGIFIGFLMSIIFAAFQLSGQYFAVQIGFGMSEVMDPVSQVSVPVIGQLKNLVGLLVFMSINGHHFLIEAVYRSFELAPLISTKKAVMGGLLKYMVHSFSGMFLIALKIALPILGTIFLISVSLGVLAKAAPQMNVLMLGFPLKIMVAFGVLIAISPLIVRIMQVSLEKTFKFITKVLIHWPT